MFEQRIAFTRTRFNARIKADTLSIYSCICESNAVHKLHTKRLVFADWQMASVVHEYADRGGIYSRDGEQKYRDTERERDSESERERERERKREKGG